MGTYSFTSSGKTNTQISKEIVKATPLPIGIKTPLRLDAENLLAMNYTAEEQIQDNVKNLLLTNWGERVGFYYFGANLQELTSEISTTEEFDEQAITRIRDAVSTWMPFIVLNDFISDIDENNRNLGLVRITITYSVPQLNIENKALQISLYVI